MNKSLEKLARRGRARAKSRPGASPARNANRPARVDWRKAASVSLIIAALSFLISVQLLPDRISLRVGDISPRDFYAEHTVRYYDSHATALARQAARLDVRPIYDVDDTAALGAKRTVKEIFDSLDRARHDYAQHTPRAISKSASQTEANLPPQSGVDFSASQSRYLLTVPPAIFEKLRATTTRLVGAAMDHEIRDTPGDLRQAVRSIEAIVREDFASAQDAAIVRMIAAQALRPNHLLNRTKTRQAQDAAARKVAPIFTPILRGDKIIGTGEVVTSDHLDKFIALGMLNPRLRSTTGVAIGALAAVMVFLVAWYIARTLPVLYANTRHLLLLAFVILLSVFGLKVGATLLGLDISGGQLGYLGMMSVAAAGMLVCVLVDMNLAVLIVALLSVLSGLIMNHEIRFAVMSMISSLVGILTVGRARDKINLLRVTGALVVTNLGLVWLLGMLLGESLADIWSGSAWAVASAFFATFLFWFGALFLEKPFGLLTHTALLELSAFDRPLLKQLCALAPGTYAHSMMVGTLAEAGAQSVGADALLCRVGGYYHDIGKMKRPEFFVENQRRENVHGRLSPSLSALIITAHVRDGVEMAVEHKLPEAIRDIIAQHHGSTLIRYFYHQALMDNTEGGAVPPGLEERFRYPGPKPQTREAAIVMLADSVEAAARALDRPSPERLDSLVANIVREKIEDGQFDECELTFKCVHGITDAFLHVLKAMMHSRIDYPEIPHTATGRPMEVVRSDLRPEPSPLPRVTDALTAMTMEMTFYPGTASAEALSETAREIEAHARPTDAHDFAPRSEAPPAVDAVTAAPRPLPIMEPEVLYGRLTTERAEPPRQDDRPAPGGSSADAGGRIEPRGS